MRIVKIVLCGCFYLRSNVTFQFMVVKCDTNDSTIWKIFYRYDATFWVCSPDDMRLTHSEKSGKIIHTNPNEEWIKNCSPVFDTHRPLTYFLHDVQYSVCGTEMHFIREKFTYFVLALAHMSARHQIFQLKSNAFNLYTHQHSLTVFGCSVCVTKHKYTYVKSRGKKAHINWNTHIQHIHWWDREANKCMRIRFKSMLHVVKWQRIELCVFSKVQYTRCRSESTKAYKQPHR